MLHMRWQWRIGSLELQSVYAPTYQLGPRGKHVRYPQMKQSPVLVSHHIASANHCCITWILGHIMHRWFWTFVWSSWVPAIVFRTRALAALLAVFTNCWYLLLCQYFRNVITYASPYPLNWTELKWTTHRKYTTHIIHLFTQWILLKST